MTPNCSKCGMPMNFVWEKCGEAMDDLKHYKIYECPKDGEIVERTG